MLLGRTMYIFIFPETRKLCQSFKACQSFNKKSNKKQYNLPQYKVYTNTHLLERARASRVKSSKQAKFQRFTRETHFQIQTTKTEANRKIPSQIGEYFHYRSWTGSQNSEEERVSNFDLNLSSAHGQVTTIAAKLLHTDDSSSMGLNQ